MFRIVLSLALFVSCLFGQANYTQTETAETTCTATVINNCGVGNPPNGGAEGRIIDIGGTGGTTEIGNTLSNGDGAEIMGWFLTDNVEGWNGGDVTVRIRITTADTQTWTGVGACRVNSACTTMEETLCSDSTITIDLNSTETKSTTMSSCNDATGESAGDLLMITIRSREDQAHGNSTASYTPDVVIDTPHDGDVAVSIQRRRHNPTRF